MHANLVATPGVMKSFGLNLAMKPLSHHATWWDYIPYFVLVAAAVALQYLQMTKMTKRNQANNTINPQMQTMQKVMPLLFAYIYFLVPAGVVIYMIVSSAIRIITQDIIFKTGIVTVSGPREIGSGSAKSSSGGGGKATRKSIPATPAVAALTDGSDSEPEPKPEPEPGATGSAKSPKQVGGGGGGGAGGASGNGSSSKSTGTRAPKPHPRSRAKRTRKAR
jgi:hypothetical protein